MENCEYYLELISASLDGELSTEDQALLDAHLAECPGCRERLSMFQLLHEQVPHLEEKPPAELVTRVMGAVRAEKAASKTHIFARFKFTVAAAVIVLVLFAASGSLNRFFPKLADQPDASQSNQVEDLQSGEPLAPATLSPGDYADSADTDGQTSAAQQEAGAQQGALQNTEPVETETPPKSSGAQKRSQAKAQPPAQTEAKQATAGAADGEQRQAAPQNADTTYQANTPEAAPDSPSGHSSTPSTSAAEPPAPEKADAPAEEDASLVKSAAPGTQADGAETGTNNSAADSAAPDTGVGGSSSGGSESPQQGDTSNGGDAAGGLQPSAAPEASPAQIPLPEIPFTQPFAFFIVVEAQSIPPLLENCPVNIFNGDYYVTFDKTLKKKLLSYLEEQSIFFSEYAGDEQAQQALFIIV